MRMMAESLARRLMDRYGFNRATLAKLVGTTQGRMAQLVRSDRPLTHDETMALAAVQIFCALLILPSDPAPGEPYQAAKDPAAWFECAVLPGSTPTPADIWRAGRRDLCTDLSTQETDNGKRAVLDRFDAETGLLLSADAESGTRPPIPAAEGEMKPQIVDLA